MNQQEKIGLTHKIYPWFSGLSADLIFYIGISTIWLTEIKGFEIYQITLLTTIASLFSIVSYFLLAGVLDRLKITTSLRIGAILLFLASIMITLGKDYIIFVIATIMMELSSLCRSTGDIAVKNNLNFEGKGQDFVKIRSKANFIYASASAVTSILNGLMFSLCKLLPMVSGIVNCFGCLLMSCFIYDVGSEDNKTNLSKKTQNKEIFVVVKQVLIVFLFYGLFYGAVVIGQQNAGLIMKDELIEIYSIEATAIYLGIAMFMARISRVASTFTFPAIYEKLKNNTIYCFSGFLSVMFILMIIGINLKAGISGFLLITVGFSMILAVRGTIDIYFKDKILENFPENSHKTMIIYLNLSRKIGTFSIGAFSSMILMKSSYLYFLFFMLILSGVIWLISNWVNQKICGDSP